MQSTVKWAGIDLEWVYSDVMRRIGRKTACVQRAKDIVHDALVFFAVSNHPARFDAPQAYFNGIVNHLLVDEYRYRQRQVEMDADIESLLISEVTPEQLWETRQKLFHLQRVVDALPARCRQVFWLFYVEEFKQSEIAAQLDISLSMVEKHLIRAMLDIRSFYQSIAQQP